LKGKCLYL